MRGEDPDGDWAGEWFRDLPTIRSIALARLALCSSSQRPNAGGDSAGA